MAKNDYSNDYSNRYSNQMDGCSNMNQENKTKNKSENKTENTRLQDLALLLLGVIKSPFYYKPAYLLVFLLLKIFDKVCFYPLHIQCYSVIMEKGDLYVLFLKENKQ